VLVVAMGLGVLAQSVPARLGMSDQEAQENVRRTIEIDSLSYTVVAKRAFMALSPAARAAMVDAGFGWTKAYVESPAFKQAYLRTRDEQKPATPEVKGTVDDELKARQAKEVKDLEDTKNEMSMLSAAQRAQLDATIKRAEDQMKTPQMIALMRTSIESDRAQAQKEYQDSLTRWQHDLPADPMILVARVLRNFLDVSKDVDFAAAVHRAGDGNLQFVNSAYEAKPGGWKMCFRAGKEAVAAARTDATNWLKTLPPAE
jgi:hypothetical protein